MTDRVPLNTRVDEDVISDFREFTHDRKGKIRGEMGRLVERAMIEYMDHDRQARLEDGQEEMLDRLDRLTAALSEGNGTHTHKGGVSPTTVSEKSEIIASKVREEHDRALHVRDLNRAIKSVAGGDDRTLAKYHDQLRDGRLVYSHPSEGSDVWFIDPATWAEVVENYVDNTLDADLSDILNPYGMRIEEYDRLLASVEVKQ